MTVRVSLLASAITAMIREALNSSPSRIAKMIAIWITVSVCSMRLNFELSVTVITVSIAPGLAMLGIASG